MWIAAADYNDSLKVFQVGRTQTSDHAFSQILRIAPAHGNQYFLCYGRNLSLPLSPHFEFSPQEDVIQAQTETCVPFSRGVETLFGRNVLIDHHVCRVVTSMTVVINNQELESGVFQEALICGVKVIAVDYSPVRLQFSREPSGLGCVVRAAWHRV